MRRRFLARTIPLALTAVLLATLSPAAGAAPAATPNSSVTFSRGAAPNGTQDDPEYIFCDVFAETPGGGGDNPVSGTGWAFCTSMMNLISIQTELIRDGAVVARERVTLPFHFGFGVSARTSQCVMGTYATAVTVQLVPPQGYFPPSLITFDGSPARFIDCRVHLPTPPQCPPSCAAPADGAAHAVRETA